MFNFFKFLCETYEYISVSARFMTSAAFTDSDAKQEWFGKENALV